MSRPEPARSVETIDEQLEALTDRIETLEAENTALKAEHRALAQALDANTSLDSVASRHTTAANETGVLELRGADSPEAARLDQIWIAGHPIGLMLTRRRSEIEGLREEIDALRMDACMTEVATDELLPIQQVTQTYEVEPSVLSANEKRAAIVWTSFLETCDRTPTKLVLDSGAVKTILRVSEDERPHNETVRRVMDLVSDLGRGLITCEKRKNTKTLVIDREEFEGFTARLGESHSDGAMETSL
ncbi:hypothetical protein [Natronorarus salvus]|uniref:hypothetical protein n=1 Tax=Natronorarus salvus TaxID=3117733 RepID=UPI002F26A135